MGIYEILVPTWVLFFLKLLYMTWCRAVCTGRGMYLIPGTMYETGKKCGVSDAPTIPAAPFHAKNNLGKQSKQSDR